MLMAAVLAGPWWVRGADVSGSISAAGEGAGSSAVEPEVWVRRMIERARAVGEDSGAPMARFDNVSFHETLASDGTVKRSREKRYEVLIRRGMTHNRLVSVDGRRLTEEESMAQTEKEKRWRDTYAANRSGGSADRMDQIVNERLFSRFDFTDGGRERVRGRDCVVLVLGPKAEEAKSEERLMDRVINLLHGRIWVDAELHEIVKAEVETRGEMRVWGGIVGSLEFFRLHVDREPGVAGIWYNRHMEVEVRGRKLFSSIWMRARELGSHLRLVDSESPAPTTSAAGTGGG